MNEDTEDYVAPVLYIEDMCMCGHHMIIHSVHGCQITDCPCYFYRRQMESNIETNGLWDEKGTRK